MADRELDARVEREVFGHPTRMLSFGTVIRDDIAVNVPEYSTDIASAWLVMEKAQTWNTGWINLPGKVLGGEPRWREFVRALDQYPQHLKAAAYARAICTAALTAIETPWPKYPQTDVESTVVSERSPNEGQTP